HLNEYVSLDLEMGFIESEHDIMDLQTRLLRHMFAQVQATCGQELETLGARVPHVTTIPRIPL
ncbi:MAG TPA: aspartate--tRNA(Asn) ligase, partial [Firmicutes bacterium]|nr:aspartate--tRNA(Asn) ligase [Bacillota bacterium]